MPDRIESDPPTQPRGLVARWRERVRDELLAQLRQGITPRKISMTIAAGLTLGLFPILGATTLLCLGVGVWLKLNQPVLQLVNWSASPLQLPGMYFFIRLGEWLTQTPPRPFSLPAMLQQARASPLLFLQHFGATGLRGILAWLLLAPPLAAIVFYTLLPLLRRVARADAAHGD